MLWLALVLFVAMAVAVLRGGRITNLADIRLNLWWLLPLGFLMQAATNWLPDRDWSPQVGVALVLLSYVPLLILVIVNRDRAGMWLSGVGVLMNFTVIALRLLGDTRPCHQLQAHRARRRYPACLPGRRHPRENVRTGPGHLIGRRLSRSRSGPVPGSRVETTGTLVQTRGETQGRFCRPTLSLRHWPGARRPRGAPGCVGERLRRQGRSHTPTRGGVVPSPPGQRTPSPPSTRRRRLRP